MTEFDRITMKETETIDDFGGKLSEIASKSSALGASIEESKLVKTFLKSLPRKKYIHIVASLEQVLDLNTTTFEDIIGRLKAYEERIQDDENTQEDQSKLLYANYDTQSNRDYNGENRGRGHFASNCPDRLLKLQEAQEDGTDDTQEADELMMHEVVYLNEGKIVPSNYEASTNNENIGYLDNGASNHMTGDRRYFSKIDTSITGKVRFSDDSRIDIKGKGSIDFTDRNSESRTMTDVYFIPDLRSNIISLGQATESGCYVRMKGEYLTIQSATR
ncbi:uncharacterized protein LOC112083123 [Eutrema salsugineum]|uniref:uncharacterized protein LOC112083123 n=1 Tax=Eutrema salsugineum TaxID=72664 RepID=UPI000CED5589|nr:uncharacterized protein LOC112083123 [Eutrema salsugineum]